MTSLIGLAMMAPWDRLKQPEPGGRMLVGVVRSVDFRARKVDVSIDYEVDGQGIEKGYGVPREASWRVKDDVWVAPVEQPGRPLGLADLKSGDVVAAFIGSRPAPGPAEYWVVHPRFRPNRLDPVQREGVKPAEQDKVSLEKLTVPMVFPVSGTVRWSDTFLADRDGGARRHLGQDILGKRFLPLVATFDGKVTLRPGGPGGHYYLSVTRADGWRCAYLHVNNDTPGTDDGLGGDAFAFAPGIRTGTEVVAGELIAYMGDSGNAEATTPHCHFELWTPEGAVVNATPSLQGAEKRPTPYVRRLYPDAKSAPGETRIDGLVTNVNLAENWIEVDSVSIVAGLAEPLRRRISIQEGTRLVVGQRFCAFVKDDKCVRILVEPDRLRQ